MFVLLMSILSVSALQITEVEANPLGQDKGLEWMEIYSAEEIDLKDYVFTNNDGGEIIINKTIQGYYVYIFKSQWLDNSDERIIVYKNGELIDKTPLFDDPSNNADTFSLCEEWTFQPETKGEKNCEETIEETPTTPKDDSSEKRDLSFLNKTVLENQEQEVINLNPKTIKTPEATSKVEGSKILKYSFWIFCGLLLFLYLIKPRKRKNEWASKSNSDDGDRDFG